ncbi:MAG: hypothetical protein ACXWH5_04790 [Actinomycetota bacterium]
MEHDISIRAHFERFPATVKGAFVLRGEGRDPHQVKIQAARVAELASRTARPLEITPVTLDVAPHLDLFVPFEFPLTDLGPGWYGLECDVEIDGVPEVVHPGAPFPVPWPRATTRRGTVAVDKAIPAGSGKVRIEAVECGGDSIRVKYASDEAVAFRFTADGAPVAVIAQDFNEGAGHGLTTAYPVLKTQSQLSIEARGGGSLDVKLP